MKIYKIKLNNPSTEPYILLKEEIRLLKTQEVIKELKKPLLSASPIYTWSLVIVI